jgi:hypothetical protein
MCPEKKLEWFVKNLDWHDDDCTEAKRIVQKRWDESYGILPSPLSSTTTRHVPVRTIFSRHETY